MNSLIFDVRPKREQNIADRRLGRLQPYAVCGHGFAKSCEAFFEKRTNFIIYRKTANLKDSILQGIDLFKTNRNITRNNVFFAQINIVEIVQVGHKILQVSNRKIAVLCCTHFLINQAIININ